MGSTYIFLSASCYNFNTYYLFSSLLDRFVYFFRKTQLFLNSKHIQTRHPKQFPFPNRNSNPTPKWVMLDVLLRPCTKNRFILSRFPYVCTRSPSPKRNDITRSINLIECLHLTLWSTTVPGLIKSCHFIRDVIANCSRATRNVTNVNKFHICPGEIPQFFPGHYP